MGKISVSRNSDKYIVSNTLSPQEEINELELIAIDEAALDGLLPIIAEQKSKDIVIRCSVAGLIPLRIYFEGVTTKKMFLDVMAKIAALMKDCEKNMMSLSNLALSLDYIFIEPTVKSVRCILWPLTNNQSAQTPSAFFGDIPFGLVFSKREDNEYVVEYLRYFRMMTRFSASGFERFILELSGKPSLAPAASEFDALNAPSARAVALRADVGSKNDLTIKICKKCGNELFEAAKFCTICGTSLVAPGAPRSSGELNRDIMRRGEEAYDATTVLETDEREHKAFPYLVREKTKETISVDKPHFRIGTNQAYSDFVISDNNTVSRSHADIITKEGRYYIIDRNSTNKTYVDGRVVEARREVEIFPGAKLRLSDEEFTFDIDI
ncbi:MAG: FHA domain-containing protein [Clostridiales bacterium]|nr:FHA domain-containing protein [Clostridiales bacterium]